MAEELPNPTDAQLQELGTQQEPSTDTASETDTSSQPESTSLTDDQLVDYRVNGEVKQAPWKDVRDGFQRQQDYTQKTQAIATRNRELEGVASQLQAREQAFVKLLDDPKQLIDLAQARMGPSQQPPPNPDEVATYGHVENTVQARLNELDQRVDQRIQATTQREEASRQYQRLEDQSNRIFSTLKDAHPVLSKIPNAEIAIRQMAAETQPQTIDAMVSAMKDAGAKLAGDLGSHYKEQAKVDAVNATKVTNQSIEPAGGSPVLPKPKAYGQGKKIDWSDLDKDAEAWLSSQIRGS
jgi:hypothetical protein|tara:strand:+ start:1496 stop:2383 length:888 start_codon:yes stop_codon:yes gene_type:complete